jgi:hypothetical protein
VQCGLVRNYESARYSARWCRASPTPEVFERVVLGEHHLLFVTLRTQVKHGLGIVMGRQVLRLIRAPRTKFDSHGSIIRSCVGIAVSLSTRPLST